MLDDFSKGEAEAARGRFGASLVVSMVVFGGVSAGVVVASAMARHTIVAEELVQVEFAPPPEPPPPLPPPPPPSTPRSAPVARLGRPRPVLEQPPEIPQERPRESDRELLPPADPFAAEEEGDPNGIEGGVIGGQGTSIAAAPPAPPPEPTRPAGPVRVIEGSTPPTVDREEIVRNFVIPAEVRSAGVARITLVVRVTIDEAGNVQSVTVLRGHPLIPNENIERAVRGSRFAPAQLADGTAYAAIHTLPITIAVTL